MRAVSKAFKMRLRLIEILRLRKGCSVQIEDLVSRDNQTGVRRYVGRKPRFGIRESQSRVSQRFSFTFTLLAQGLFIQIYRSNLNDQTTLFQKYSPGTRATCEDYGIIEQGHKMRLQTIDGEHEYQYCV
ncbi:hypothetical protein AA0229_1177 [Gluconobacter cerinus NRIC 0229]|nr:hypothetical protein AA0229_1177 [Gluconobacter cerinus NRIC 0229]